jgi:hypothetical protein
MRRYQKKIQDSPAGTGLYGTPSRARTVVTSSRIPPAGRAAGGAAAVSPVS